MKIISLRPPWGLLICANLKDCENRDWRSNFTGEVLIHQSKRWDPEGLAFSRGVDLEAWNYLVEHLAMAHAYGIIGKATFGKCADLLYSKWFFGKFAYPVSNGVLFDQPVYCKGQLGFFNASAEVEEKVRGMERNDHDKRN